MDLMLASKTRKINILCPVQIKFKISVSENITQHYSKLHAKNVFQFTILYISLQALGPKILILRDMDL